MNDRILKFRDFAISRFRESRFSNRKIAKSRIREVIFALAFLIALPLGAQEAINVVLIEVPVNVVDRAGTAVPGLTAANFEVTDEGKKRAITHFEAIDLAKPLPRSERFRFNPAARRNFLVVFDLTYSSPGTTERAAEAARSFIRTGMTDRDLTGIATFSVERGFQWITAFTTDRATLLKAVDGIGSAKRINPGDPLLLSVLLPGEGAPGSTGGGAGEGAGERSQRADEIQQAQIEIARGNRKANEEIERARIRKQLDNFGALARVLDRVRGQKQVILLSEGFDATLLQGRAASDKSQDDADFEATTHGEVWKIDNDQRFGNTAVASVLDQMASLFRRSDVVLHTMDIKGLRSDVDAREGRKPASTDSLFLMANSTGGQLFKNSNDVAENFDRMLRQQQVVYILGFQVPAPGTPGKFHNLKVRVKDVPGARVSHRAGYYEPSTASNNLEKTLSAVEILMNDIPHDEVALDMFAAPFRSSIGNPQVPVVLEIGGTSMLEGVSGNSLEGELFLYAFDKDAAVRDYLYQRLTFDLSKVRDRLSTSGVKFYGAMNLPPGDYDVKALVRVMQTGRVGYQRVSVQVPDFSKPAFLPPIVVGEEAGWIMVKAAPRRPAEVDYPFTIASQSFVPRAAASMKTDGSYEVALFGYNLNAEGLELSVSVRDSAGTERAANVALLGRTPAGAEGPTKLLFNFKPTGLAAGKYALDFNVKSRELPERQRVSVPFVVN